MRRVLVSLCCAAIVLACGCESNDSGGGSGGRLAGTRWRLSAWSATSQDPSHFTITADFDAERISGTSAVNSYGGAYTATSSGRFSVGALQSTLMGGSEEAMRAESTYFELLGKARKYTVTRSTLTLLDDGNAGLLTFGSR